MTFQVSGLPVAQFQPLFGLPDHELAGLGVMRRFADAFPGFPCRVSLRDAEPGETLLLLNYEHLAVATPYRSRYAIYVRENATAAALEPGEVPDVLRRRLLSLRAFRRDGMLQDCDVVEGRHIEPSIERLFAAPGVDYIHVHNAKAGCFAARIDRL